MTDSSTAPSACPVCGQVPAGPPVEGEGVCGGGGGDAQPTTVSASATEMASDLRAFIGKDRDTGV